MLLITGHLSKWIFQKKKTSDPDGHNAVFLDFLIELPVAVLAQLLQSSLILSSLLTTNNLLNILDLLTALSPVSLPQHAADESEILQHPADPVLETADAVPPYNQQLSDVEEVSDSVPPVTPSPSPDDVGFTIWKIVDRKQVGDEELRLCVENHWTPRLKDEFPYSVE